MQRRRPDPASARALSERARRRGQRLRLQRRGRGYEDLVKSGVIDPTKVVRTERRNAASVAILLLTTDAFVSDLPEREKEGAGAGHSH